MENNRELKENYRRVGALLKRKFIRGNNPDTQQKVLGILAQNDGITQKELSGMLGIRPQSGGEIVRKLENNGYVERIPDENDSRAQRLHLTEAGVRENEKLNRQADQETVIDCLDGEEKTMLNRLLTKIVNNTEKLEKQELKVPNRMNIKPRMEYFMIDDDED
ncbi:MAG: MarR family transcriptional regulator [Erysipelotrichaceae bacterium]|nr:MarR family transcriptional regulator [Erysipelotrichaceae bacterium]